MPTETKGCHQKDETGWCLISNISVLFSSSKTARLRDGLGDFISDEPETEANCPPESGEKHISSHSYYVPWIRNKTVCNTH